MRSLAFILILLPLYASSVHARPVSYPGGWTLMLRNDAGQNNAHAHYTLDPFNSVGLRVRYDRENDFTFIGGQVNRLVKRWNKSDSQANIYAKVGAGYVADDFDNNAPTALKRKSDEALFLGLSADWETRRYFVSAETEYWDNGRFGDYSSTHGRVGIAPYVAGTGAFHSWVMIEGHYSPENGDPVGASAILRIFKGPSLLELGVNDQGDPLVNYIHRF